MEWHRGVTQTLGARGDGSLRERLGQPGRVDVAVTREVGGSENAVCVDQRKEFASAFGGDDLEGNAHQFRDALAVFELVEPILRSGQPQAAAPMQVDRLSRLGLERLVQIDAVPEQLHQVEARIELGAETRRMPGRAARELVLLHK